MSSNEFLDMSSNLEGKKKKVICIRVFKNYFFFFCQDFRLQCVGKIFPKIDLLQVWLKLAARSTGEMCCDAGCLGFFHNVTIFKAGHGFCDMEDEMCHEQKYIWNTTWEPYMYRTVLHRTMPCHWSVELVTQMLNKMIIADEFSNIWNNNKNLFSIFKWVWDEMSWKSNLWLSDILKIFYVVVNPDVVQTRCMNQLDAYCEVIVEILDIMVWLGEEILGYACDLEKSIFDIEPIKYEIIDVVMDFDMCITKMIEQIHFCFCFNSDSNQFIFSEKQFQLICETIYEYASKKDRLEYRINAGLRELNTKHDIFKVVKDIVYKKNIIRCNQCYLHIAQIFGAKET